VAARQDNGAAEDTVFDLDALQRTEIPEPFTFKAAGQTFHLATPEDLDWHHQTTFAEGDPVKVISILLGDEWERFDHLYTPEGDRIVMPGWKIEKLLWAWAKHNGISVPESEASSTSFAPTVKPSRRTSGATTTRGSRTSRRGA
jgi:hypothetical protein